jgi:hypothetical protein
MKELGSILMSLKPDFCNIPRMLSRSGVVLFVLSLAALVDGAAVDGLGALVCAMAAVVHISNAVPVARSESRICFILLSSAAQHTVNLPPRWTFRELSDMRELSGCCDPMKRPAPRRQRSGNAAMVENRGFS